MNPYDILSYDCVLPSAIIFNDNLEPAAVKAYAVIRNLARTQGYCYATNSYLANILKCDISTVKRWISSLETEGFLDIETDKLGINWQRRIFISCRFKEMFTKVQKSPPPSAKMNHTIEDNTNKRQKTVCPEPPVGVPEPPKKVFKIKGDGTTNSIELDEVFRKSVQQNKNWTEEEIKEAWKVLADYKGRVNDSWKFLEGTIENLRKKNNLDKLRKIDEVCQKKNTEISGPSKTLTQEEIDMRLQHSQRLFSHLKTNKK